jgi:hypothetical protein
MIVDGFSSNPVINTALQTEDGKMTAPSKSHCFGSSGSFPIKLHTLLEDASRLGFDDVVCWQPGGASFKVLQPKRFDSEIMKNYFQQTKYKSFQRQLNIYGFRRVHHGPFKGGYTHPKFKRETPDFSMTRKPKHRGNLLSKHSLTSTELDTICRSASDNVMSLVGSECFRSGGDDFYDDSSVIAMNDLLSDFLFNYDDAPDDKNDPEEDFFSVDKTTTSDYSTFSSTAEAEEQSVVVKAEADPGTASGSTDDGDSSSSDRFFPCKLFIMLEDAEKEIFSDIVSWVQGGTAFKVHNRQEFVTKVMPNYFDQTQFESFRRQLNMYGFSRINKGKDRGVAAHPSFLRGHRGLCEKLTRVAKHAVR